MKTCVKIKGINLVKCRHSEHYYRGFPFFTKGSIYRNYIYTDFSKYANNYFTTDMGAFTSVKPR